eukprot:9282188-Lingulodinium_polyedra.AAC.1
MTNRQRFQYCPNCRGAGAIIAVWPYIDQERITQSLGQSQVPNALEANASVYDIRAYNPNMPTPPTPR